MGDMSIGEFESRLKENKKELLSNFRCIYSLDVIVEDLSSIGKVHLKYEHRGDKTSNNSCDIVVMLSEDGVTEATEELKYILEGVKIVSDLNSRVKKLREDSNMSLRVNYKWSDSNSNKCKVVSWNYDEVTVMLGRKSVEKLIVYYSNLEDSILNYKDNVWEFITEFNNQELNCVIGAELRTESIYKELENCMYKLSDLPNLSDALDMGDHLVRVLVSSRELGIIGLFDVKVNKVDKNIAVTLVDDKYINTITSRFVRDSALTKALTCLVESKADSINVHHK